MLALRADTMKLDIVLSGVNEHAKTMRVGKFSSLADDSCTVVAQCAAHAANASLVAIGQPTLQKLDGNIAFGGKPRLPNNVVYSALLHLIVVSMLSVPLTLDETIPVLHTHAQHVSNISVPQPAASSAAQHTNHESLIFDGSLTYHQHLFQQS
jgi:hypothetical protein